jgi:hypothetical protein
MLSTGHVWWIPVCVGGGRYKERVKENECNGNIMDSCMKMEK